MPTFWPSSETHCSHPPRCPMVILSASCAAAAEDALSSARAAARVRRSRDGYMVSSGMDPHPLSPAAGVGSEGVPRCLDTAALRLALTLERNMNYVHFLFYRWGVSHGSRRR